MSPHYTEALLVYRAAMGHVIKGEPTDITLNTKVTRFRWIKVWRSHDRNCWTTRELAAAWTQDQGGDVSKVVEDSGFMPEGEQEPRVFIIEGKHWTAWALGTEFEIESYEDKVRARALMKLSTEERRVLGVEA